MRCREQMQKELSRGIIPGRYSTEDNFLDRPCSVSRHAGRASSSPPPQERAFHLTGQTQKVLCLAHHFHRLSNAGASVANRGTKLRETAIFAGKCASFHVHSIVIPRIRSILRCTCVRRKSLTVANGIISVWSRSPPPVLPSLSRRFWTCRWLGQV